MVILSILRLPFRIVRMPLSLVLLAVGAKHRRSFNLPVAGLNESKAQSIYFALKRAATTPMEEEVAQQWLASLQIVQVASGRIMADLYSIDANLQFWTRRLEHGGGHFWFTLLHRGPVAFIRRLGEILSRRGRHDIALRDERGGAEVTAGELVEKRVLLLRLLRGQLCEAAAAVQHAGALLYLQRRESSGNSEIDGLFSRAEGAIQESMHAVSTAMTGLQQGVHMTLDSQQGPEAPAANDRPMLAQSLNKVLGITTRLRHVWSQQGAAPPETPAGGIDPTPLLENNDNNDTAENAEINESTGLETEDYDTGAPGALRAAQKSIQFTPLVSQEASVHSVLIEARRATAVLQRTSRLVSLPDWVAMPSHAQRYWVQYTAVGIVVGYSTIFIIRHSPLAGSSDLEDWGKAAVSAVQGAWGEHIIAPLERLKGELFNTFRRRPAIVSMDEYEADRDSLERMLDDFKADYIRKRGVKAATTSTIGGGGGSGSQGLASNTTAATAAGAVEGVSNLPVVNDEQLLHGMEIMMRSYEQELKRPIRHLVSGDLMRSLLIQVQKLKVDTESAMLEIDQILRANELSISLVAAIPTFLIASAALYGLGSVLTPAPPDPRSEAVGARLAMIEVERALEALAACEESISTAAAGEVQGDMYGRTSEAEGMLAYRLSMAYSEAEELFKRHEGLFRSAGSAEWPNLRSDLLELATPAPAAQKLRTAARMIRAYAIFQQF